MNEFSHFLESCKDGILSTKGMLSKEYLKSGLVLMFAGLKISKRAGKLIEIIIKKVDMVDLSFFHLMFINCSNLVSAYI